MNIKMVDLHNQYLSIRNEIDDAINKVITSSTFIKGPDVEKLEKELSRFLNVKHCITCGNGTDAILLSLMAINLTAGDEVIVPAFSFAAPAEAVALLGGIPVFADVDKDTFNIDPASVKRLISSRTKAVIPVHLFGQPCAMPELLKIAEKYGLKIIEDNAQSLGSKCNMSDNTQKYAGTVGHIGCTSFFPSKVLGCFGDGGAIFTNDDVLAQRIRALANHGQKTKYYHQYLGFNSRLDTIQAAVLNAELPHLNDWINHRKRAADYYTSNLKDLPAVKLPTQVPFGTHVYHQYTIKVKSVYRDKLKVALDKAEIPSMIYYPMPLPCQPIYQNSCICDPYIKNAMELPYSVLSLPMHSELTNRQQDIIIETIKLFFTQNKEDILSTSTFVQNN